MQKPSDPVEDAKKSLLERLRPSVAALRRSGFSWVRLSREISRRGLVDRNPMWFYRHFGLPRLEKKRSLRRR